MTNDISNDTELMARLAKGDMSALGDIVRKHQDKVLSLSYRVLGDWHGAEDVTQEAFVRLWQRCPAPDQQGRTAWLNRVTYNLCIDVKRQRRRSLIQMEVLAASPEKGTGPRPAMARTMT